MSDTMTTLPQCDPTIQLPAPPDREGEALVAAVAPVPAKIAPYSGYRDIKCELGEHRALTLTEAPGGHFYVERFYWGGGPFTTAEAARLVQALASVADMPCAVTHEDGLHVFKNQTDWYVARDADDAYALQQEETGITRMECESDDPFRLLDDDDVFKLWCTPDGELCEVGTRDGAAVERPASYWAKKCGRGMLGTTEY